MAALQWVGNSNFQSGTLGSSYTAGGGTLSLTAGHGARFPASGDFWVRVQTSESSGGDAEIFKATSRSTDTLTVTGAQDGTSAQNHGSGSIVVWAMSAGALTQFKTDCTSGGSAGIILLEEQVASGSASLDFTSTISATYDTYQFEFVTLLPATDGATINMQVSTDGGGTWVTSGSYSYWDWRFDSSTAAAGGATGATAIVLAETNGVGNAAAFGLVGMIQLYNPSSASLHKSISGNIAFRNAAGTRISHIVAGAYEATTAVNAVRFLASSGNLASGTIRSYGLAKP